MFSFINKKAEEAGGFTMVPKDFNYLETLGSRVIGFYDLLMMNMYYNCTDVCKDAPTRCHSGGFAHPRDCSKCICPSGYGGRFCRKRPPGCGRTLRAKKEWETLEDPLNSTEVEGDGYTRCTYWIR
ncbi:hypothetical protein TELCIR_20805, partial [Teladorsagia circumcincta]